jgi:hypothetical protein
MVNTVAGRGSAKLRVGLVVSIIGFVCAALFFIFIFCDVEIPLVCWVLSFLAPLICGVVGVVQSRRARLLGEKSKLSVFAFVLSLLDVLLGAVWLIIDITALLYFFTLIAA